VNGRTENGKRQSSDNLEKWPDATKLQLYWKEQVQVIMRVVQMKNPGAEMDFGVGW